jgi:hypothetical protein
LKGFVNEINESDNIMDLVDESEDAFYNIPNKNINNNFKFLIENSISIELKGFEYYNLMDFVDNNGDSFYNPRRKIFLLTTDNENKLEYIVDSISTNMNLESM